MVAMAISGRPPLQTTTVVLCKYRPVKASYMHVAKRSKMGNAMHHIDPNHACLLLRDMYLKDTFVCGY